MDRALAAIRFLEQIWRKAPIGMLHIGSDGVVLNANPAFCHYLGCRTDEQLVGHRFWDLMVGGVEASRAAWDARPTSSPPLDVDSTFHNTYRGVDGRPVDLEWVGQGIVGDDGSVVAFCRRAHAH